MVRAVALREKYLYKVGNGVKLYLFVIKPPGWVATDRRPSIVFFHGGAWTMRKGMAFNDQSCYLAWLGMVCIQPQYRLLDEKHDEPPIICIEDAKSSMRWIRNHARDLGIDPNLIASCGGSVGGHLAAFVGMIDGCDDPCDDLSLSPKSQAMALFNPVIDSGPGAYGYKRMKDRYRELSPFYNVRRNSPPAVVFQGARDNIIPVKTIEEFKVKMNDAGVRCDIFIYAEKGHGFFRRNKDPKCFYDTVGRLVAFLTSLGWLQEMPPPPAWIRIEDILKEL